MLLRELDGVQLYLVDTPAEAEQWLPSFVDAYRTVFSGEPYYEAFTPEDAARIYRNLTSTPENITLLAVDDDRVVAFGIAIPLVAMPSVARQLTGLVPVRNTFYMAELGVLQSHRARKLGRTLVQLRLDLVDAERYEGVVLRVAESRNTSYLMYCAMGFADMGVYMDVRSKRIDGRVTSDRRLFLHCILSQVDVARVQTEEISL